MNALTKTQLIVIAAAAAYFSYRAGLRRGLAVSAASTYPVIGGVGGVAWLSDWSPV